MPELFLWSRLAIWAAALFALYVFQPDRNPRAYLWDGPVFHDLGSFTDVWARWDSGWFLRIAEHGYHTGAETAFYPLYPALLAAAGSMPPPFPGTGASSSERRPSSSARRRRRSTSSSASGRTVSSASWASSSVKSRLGTRL